MPDPARERPRFSLRRVSGSDRSFADDVRDGLTAIGKAIPPRHFYDDLGSALFDAICRLPEYYPTRAEGEVLRRNQRQIAEAVGAVSRIVELGSGSALKTRVILDAFSDRELEYIPIDVDSNVLERSGRELVHEYDHLSVHAVCADFTRPVRALEGVSGGGSTLMLFLGSTIGNFHPREATTLLRDVRHVLRPGDAFLVGADLKKSPEVLDAAYNDALGVTAAFNLNLLQRINRELGGHFDLRAFKHRAFYDAEQSRIEMHLVSLREQSIRIDALNLEVAFSEGETIHTENSYKYDRESLAAIAEAAGFEIAQLWTDSQVWFADALLRPVNR